ncbi:MAG: tripartite tricarboxylate transporter substrate binding protein [Betaproteobacteria bacterium]|jgi:tripartite-type tricarboxylate transporter receptor subunit TctC|nr:tripartite tricarboxylate transporter substrate binding protein [Betaproteobacteria bacterium]
MIVGSPPGSGSDLTVRLLAQRLSDRLPKGVIIENRPGAVGAIALEIAANATPDGYTLMSLSTQNLTAMLLKTVRTDIPNVFAPVAQTTSQPYLLVVYSALPVATVTQLIAYAKAKPLVYASSGTGSAVHLGMELFKSMAGIEITHVPYKGSGLSMIDLMSGRVQLAITNTVTASPLVKNARIRALAVTSATRSAAFPDVPTIAESGVPGYELGSWYGILAPIKTGGALIDILNKHINAVIAQPEFKEKLAEEGAEAAPPNTPAEFKALIANEVRRWDRFLKSSRLKLD